eukprot:NODE_993_length_1334_cov_9.997665_g820_i0.p1 GENE.NODE_993_length_1334_cov_9.997665_g820_i0~~NODE_993_length_1334_cov_9.997665_g820_i0.p1  ORF type:complete len:441 (+),score=50.62 NODE_993_length_1334_cov_9.997665_g820_i0:161-1324(+)
MSSETSKIVGTIMRRGSAKTKAQLRIEMASRDSQNGFIMLWVKCKKLKKSDRWFGKVDPMCTLFLKDLESDMFFELGRTNLVINSYNPVFYHPITVRIKHLENLKQLGNDPDGDDDDDDDELFQKKVITNLRFVVNDVDIRTNNIGHDDIIGIADWNLSDLLTVVEQKFVRKMDLIVDNKKFGELTVYYENVKMYRGHIDTSGGKLFFKIAGSCLEPRFPFRSVNAYLKLSRYINDRLKHPIYVSEPIESREPYWDEFMIPFNAFCNAELDTQITFEVWNKSYGIFNDQLLGKTLITLEQLFDGNFEFRIQNKDGFDMESRLYIMNCKITPKNILQQKRKSAKNLLKNTLTKGVGATENKMKNFMKNLVAKKEEESGLNSEKENVLE